MKRVIVTLIIFMLSSLAANAQIPDRYHGLYASDTKECEKKEGPSQRIYVTANTFGEYENHCKVVKVGRGNQQITLDLVCKMEGDKHEEFVRMSSLGQGVIMVRRQRDDINFAIAMPLLFCSTRPD